MIIFLKSPAYFPPNPTNPFYPLKMSHPCTKVVFASLQLLYTLITILPPYFLYSSYRLSCAYLVLIFGWGTWNGASYYIEVFAERYRLQFVREEERTRQ